MPHLIYGQYLNYMFQTPTTQVWKKLYDEGKLQPPRTHFWERKPPEELYDLQNDPDEVRNLANSRQHQRILAKLRAANREHLLRIRDVGLLPEAEMHRRSQGSTPYELGHDNAKFPLKRILDTAELASSSKSEALPKRKRALSDKDNGVRYWAALGILMRGKSAVASSHNELVRATTDESPSVRIVAAQALGEFGNDTDVKRSLDVLLPLADVNRSTSYWSCVEALNAIDYLDERARPALTAINALSDQANVIPKLREYPVRLLEKIKADLR
jgi:uncharacterized sulfatase